MLVHYHKGETMDTNAVESAVPSERESPAVQEARQRAARRLEHLAPYTEWTRQLVLSSVSDWTEAFLIGAECYRQRARDTLERSPDNPRMTERAKEDAKEAEELERCAAIYGEERAKIEPALAEMRRRAGERMSDALGSGDYCELLEDDPQEWLLKFDWT